MGYYETFVVHKNGKFLADMADSLTNWTPNVSEIAEYDSRSSAQSDADDFGGEVRKARISVSPRGKLELLPA